MAVAFTQEMKFPRIVERKDLGLPDAYIVELEDLFQTFLPWTIKPLSDAMPISFFMDVEGKIHFEFNHSTFKLPKLIKYGSLFRPSLYYKNLVDKLIKTSLLFKEKRLVAGIHFTYHFKSARCELHNLVILPRRLCPDMDPEIREMAIFRVQRAIDHMMARMGGSEIFTTTLVIPHERVRILGWNRLKLKTFKQFWEAFWGWWPISLRGLQRVYVKRYRNLAPGGNR